MPGKSNKKPIHVHPEIAQALYNAVVNNVTKDKFDRAFAWTVSWHLARAFGIPTSKINYQLDKFVKAGKLQKRTSTYCTEYMPAHVEGYLYNGHNHFVRVKEMRSRPPESKRFGTHYANEFNSTQFTNCCGLAILETESCCPGCKKQLP